MEHGQNSIRFIDLFAGIGGMRLGFEGAGAECVFTSEWDSRAQETYLANFDPDESLYGDITEIDEQEVPDHEILVGGFPCQPFSIAGVSKKNSLGRAHGFDCETQGTLFFDIERILAAKQPEAFVLENVKNLQSHDRGRTFDVILRVLSDQLGYHVTTRVINSKGFVPQGRERIFIVGIRGESDFDVNEIALPDPEMGPRMRDILHPEDGTEDAEDPYTIGPKAQVNPKYTLTPRLWEYLQGYAAKHKAAGNGFGYGLVGPDDVSRTLSARYYKDGSEVLIKQTRKRPRRLTPREAARLMGFDTQSRHWNIPVSDMQAYKQFGNAVVPAVVGAIADELVPVVAARTARAGLATPGVPIAA